MSFPLHNILLLDTKRYFTYTPMSKITGCAFLIPICMMETRGAV